MTKNTETKEEEQTEEPKEFYNLAEVPTGKALVIATKDGDVMEFAEAIVLCLNEIKKIKEQVGVK